MIKIKYTNKFNLPEEVVQWLKLDEYDYHPDVYSATTLMKPARMVALERQHQEELEIDYSDLIASRYGTALHDSFEKVELKGYEQEQRLFCDIKIDENFVRKISGKFDLLKHVKDNVWMLKDLKSTSVWTYVYGSKEEEYIKQLSIYRYLCSKNFPEREITNKAEIIFMFTDWSKSKAYSSQDYPNTRVTKKEINLWSIESTETYIKSRLRLFYETQMLDASQMPKCTREELWLSDDKFAVMKENRKSAVKVFDNNKDALDFIDTLTKDKNKHKVEIRQSKAKRCEYCLVRKFCNQYKELKEKGLVD